MLSLNPVRLFSATAKITKKSAQATQLHFGTSPKPSQDAYQQAPSQHAATGLNQGGYGLNLQTTAIEQGDDMLSGQTPMDAETQKKWDRIPTGQRGLLQNAVENYTTNRTRPDDVALTQKVVKEMVDWFLDKPSVSNKGAVTRIYGSKRDKIIEQANNPQSDGSFGKRDTSNSLAETVIQPSTQQQQLEVKPSSTMAPPPRREIGIGEAPRSVAPQMPQQIFSEQPATNLVASTLPSLHPPRDFDPSRDLHYRGLNNFGHHVFEIEHTPDRNNPYSKYIEKIILPR